MSIPIPAQSLRSGRYWVKSRVCSISDILRFREFAVVSPGHSSTTKIVHPRKERNVTSLVIPRKELR